MAVNDTKNEKTPRDPVRQWTLIVLGLIVVLFFYSRSRDRLTPYTSQATVQAFVVRMAPGVAGRVIEVNVTDNQRVKGGDVLFRLDPQPFELALQQAEAEARKAAFIASERRGERSRLRVRPASLSELLKVQ